MNPVYSKDQEQAIDDISNWLFENKPGEYVLSGKSGSGKTTVLMPIIELANKKKQLLSLITNEKTKELNIIATATTNSAAKVLSNILGIQARTIHSLLGLSVQNNTSDGKQYLKRTRESNIIRNSLIIIDEASMCDEFLLEMIRKLSMDCMILYTLDEDQLPPVKENICKVMKLGLPTSILTTPHRQKSNLEIKELGEKCRLAIKSNIFPRFESNNNNIHMLSGEEFKTEIHRHFISPTDSKVICYTNARVHAYNAHIRGLQGYGEDLEVGEKLMNRDPILSKATYLPVGSVSTITNIQKAEFMGIEGFKVELNNSFGVFMAKDVKDKTTLMKKYAATKEWSTYFILKEKIVDLRPTHSITSHVAQGSTFENVFLDLTDISKCTINSTTARLLYVSLTRATSNVYCYGELNPKRYSNG